MLRDLQAAVKNEKICSLSDIVFVDGSLIV